MYTPTRSPSYDNKIFRKFSSRTLESKLENKLKFQKELHWVAEPKIPLLCIPGGMSDEQGGTLFQDTINGIMALNGQLVVLGIGSEEYGRIFTALEQQYRHRVRILKDDDALRRQMYAAADIGLFFSAHANEEEVANCLSYGVIPVSPARDGLEDYNPTQESGNAFLADPANPWTWFAALVRAGETYKLPYDWRTIQRHAMETVKEGEPE